MKDSIVSKLYKRKWKKVALPFYLRIGKYKLSMYAMNLDWESLRIKIEDTSDWTIIYVIKEGKY